MNVLTINEENFFELVEIKEISKETEIINCVDLTIEEDESFVLANGIISHNSALGSLLQRRDPARDGAYALKGKIKNARSLGDLSENKEILEIMQILNLDPHTPNQPCAYEKIVIATDQDFDGHHITSLLISLFYNWFPWIIEKKMLHCLETPLITTGDKKKEYFYSIQEFEQASAKKKQTNVRYLKGLGSLSLEDWGFVMGNKQIINIVKDKKSGQMLEMAFGKDSGLRKTWLSS